MGTGSEDARSSALLEEILSEVDPEHASAAQVLADSLRADGGSEDTMKRARDL